jgi:7-cyano-7-deazaguanine reductase
MPKAEGKTYKFLPKSAIDKKVLEVIKYSGEKQLIEYKTREFSAVCPFSGLPDYGELVVRYVPSGKIVELKSLKYYIISFRNVGVYQEEATDIIFKDLYSLLKPKYLCLETVYNTRGGIDAKCVIEKGKK